MNIIRKIRRKEKQKDMLGVLTNSFENESRVALLLVVLMDLLELSLPTLTNLYLLT